MPETVEAENVTVGMTLILEPRTRTKWTVDSVRKTKKGLVFACSTHFPQGSGKCRTNPLPPNRLMEVAS